MPKRWQRARPVITWSTLHGGPRQLPGPHKLQISVDPQRLATAAAQPQGAPGAPATVQARTSCATK